MLVPVTVFFLLFILNLLKPKYICFFFFTFVESPGERSGRGIVTDGITTPIVNTSAYWFKNTAELIDFKVMNT